MILPEKKRRSARQGGRGQRVGTGNHDWSKGTRLGSSSKIGRGEGCGSEIDV